MTDQELIQSIKADDRVAFDLLFKKYYTPLVGYIRSLSQDINIAEDIVQQVFMTLWMDRNTLKIKKTVKGYLYWVTYTTYVNQYRKNKHRMHLLESVKEKALRDAIPEDRALINARIEKLKQIIETLPPMSKKVLEMNKLGGLKYDEIAEHLNLSKKTVESHMRTAFIKIRQGFDNDKLIMFFLNELFPSP